jgi:N-acetylneuraminic acid mutarotase
MSYPYEEEYKSTVFEYQDFPADWPMSFAILTAYATTGETWTPEQNVAADRQLEAELRKGGHRIHRISGYSKDFKTHEEGWAVVMDLKKAWDLAVKYKQVALFYYENDELLLVYALGYSRCDEAVVKVPRPGAAKTSPFLARKDKK